MTLKTISLSGWLRSALGWNKKSEIVERRLEVVRQRLTDHICSVDMRYTAGGNIPAEVRTTWVPICEGVSQVSCQLPTRHSTILNVVFDPLAAIPSHHHPEHQETIFVVEGHVLDADTGERIGEGQTYIIPPMQVHTITAGSKGALLNVIFRPRLTPLEIESACHKADPGPPLPVAVISP
jgi:quercetin dioxygenase-like cupin family protein